MSEWVIIKKSYKSFSVINISSSREKAIRRLRRHLVTEIENTNEDTIDEWNADSFVDRKVNYAVYMTRLVNKKIDKIENQRRESLKWKGERYLILQDLSAIQRDNQITA